MQCSHTLAKYCTSYTVYGHLSDYVGALNGWVFGHQLQLMVYESPIDPELLFSSDIRKILFNKSWHSSAKSSFSQWGLRWSRKSSFHLSTDKSTELNVTLYREFYARLYRMMPTWITINGWNFFVFLFLRGSILFLIPSGSDGAMRAKSTSFLCLLMWNICFCRYGITTYRRDTNLISKRRPSRWEFDYWRARLYKY